MHQKKNKISLIFCYILILLFLTTLNNKNFSDAIVELFKIKQIKITGVDFNSEKEIYNLFNQFNNKNLISIDKQTILEIINSSEIIENYSVIKKLPSTLILNLEQTKFLASFFKNGKKYYLGSNGREILSEKYNNNSDIPIIYGKFNSKNFLELLSQIEKNNISINDIKQFYYFQSNRWDFKTKNDVLVKLPNTNLDRVLKLYLFLREKNEKKKIIDLRVSNQVIITNG